MKKSEAIVCTILDGALIRKHFYPYDASELREVHRISEEHTIILVAPYSNPRKGIKQYYEAVNRLKGKPIRFIHWF